MLNIRWPNIQDIFLVNLSQVNIRKLRQIRSGRFSGCQLASSSFRQHSASTTTISSLILSTSATYKYFSIYKERLSTESDTVYLLLHHTGRILYIPVFSNEDFIVSTSCTWSFHCFPTVEFILDDPFLNSCFSSYLLARYKLCGAISFEFQTSKLSTG